MGDDFGIGLGLEDVALAGQLRPQLPEVLDDAVVDDRDTPGGVRMGVDLVGLAVGRPAGVADAGSAPLQRRIVTAAARGCLQLAGRAAARQHAILQRGDAGRVVAPIFQPLQRLDDLPRDRARAQDPNDAAHGRSHPSQSARAVLSRVGRLVQSGEDRVVNAGPHPVRAALAALRAARSVAARPAFVAWRARPIASASSGDVLGHGRARRHIGVPPDA